VPRVVTLKPVHFAKYSVFCFSDDSHKVIISLHDINLFFVRVRDSVLCEFLCMIYLRLKSVFKEPRVQ